MVTYKVLKQTNILYQPETIEENCLLYKGGNDLAKCAGLFLTQQEDESDEFYSERCATAYDPIYANTLNRFKSLLFSTPLSIVPSSDTNNTTTDSTPVNTALKEYLKKFEKNCDGKGTSLHNFTKQTFLEAMKLEKAVTMVDFPRVLIPKTNKQDQLDSGDLDAKLVNIPLKNIINWQYDDEGDLQWLMIFTLTMFKQDAISPTIAKYQWIQIGLINGRVTLRTWAKEIDPETDKITDEDEIPELPEIVTSFDRLNIVEMCIPSGLALGNLMAPAAKQLFRIDSYINAASLKNTVNLAVLKAGNNLAAPVADGRRAINTVQMNPNRFQSPVAAMKTKGWMLIGKDDSAEILETQGTSITILQEQKKMVIQRFNAAVHQASQNIQSKAQALSAAAKQEDRRDTEIVLNEYKLIVEHYIMQVISLVLNLRQEDEVSLHMEGLNVEDDVDRAEIITELQAYGQFPEAEIFRVNFEYNAALGLCGDDMDEDDKTELRKQIEQTIKSRPSPEEQANMEASGKGGTKLAQTNNDPNAVDPPEMTDSGHIATPEGAHLSDDAHVDSSVVFDQLSDDYKEKDIEFVKHIPWLDITAIPLSSIDFSNKDNWQATQEPDKIDEFAQKIENGFDKPIILVNNKSNNNKMQVVDGHHRLLAHEKLAQPVPAYVGLIGTDRGPWDKLHNKQVGSMTEQSIQKEASNQIVDSEQQ